MWGYYTDGGEGCKEAGKATYVLPLTFFYYDVLILSVHHIPWGYMEIPMRQLAFLILMILALQQTSTAQAEDNDVQFYFPPTPEGVFEHIPILGTKHFEDRTYSNTFNIPHLGEMPAQIRYFESEVTADELIGPGAAFGVTVVQPVDNRTLNITVMVAGESDEQIIANKAVNALLPFWLTLEGVDMYTVYSKPMGEYRFSWNNYDWSFDQLTELVSWTVSAQTLPGGYMSNDQVRVCEGIPSPVVEGHDTYALVRYVLSRHGCNMTKAHGTVASAIKAFIATAPQM